MGHATSAPGRFDVKHLASSGLVIKRSFSENLACLLQRLLTCHP